MTTWKVRLIRRQVAVASLERKAREVPPDMYPVRDRLLARAAQRRKTSR